MRYLPGLVLLFLLGCVTPEAETWTADSDYLTSPVWNDGRAEVAFYQVNRSVDQYGRDTTQSFLAGTYLVKHDFDERAESKATGPDGTPAFKYAFFYEFESRSYEYKRSWVVNARQRDLGLLKASFASFDWCANQYREFAKAGKAIRYLYRSDDYGNEEGRLSVASDVVPFSLLPVLVRGAKLEEGDSLTVPILDRDGRVISARLDRLPDRAGEEPARVIRVVYAEPVASLIGETSALEETWYVSDSEERLLLEMEATGGRYRMVLVEHLRSAYWQEDLYERLSVVTARP